MDFKRFDPWMGISMVRVHHLLFLLPLPLPLPLPQRMFMGWSCVNLATLANRPRIEVVLSGIFFRRGG